MQQREVEAPAGAAPPPPPTGTSVGIAGRAVSDVAAKEDHLGFEPYVSAVARFLEETEAPITVSIEGKWGSGKSTFMDLLADRLQEKTPKPIVVRFNPWRHENAAALWTAFGAEFVRRVKEDDDLPWWQRHLGDLRLWSYQRAGVLARAGVAVALAGVLLAFAFLLLLLPEVGLPPWLVALAGAGEDSPLLLEVVAAVGAGGGGLVTLYLQLTRTLADPVERALGEQGKRPAEPVPLIERVNKDMVNILEHYAPHRRVYVLIDDLDRSTRAAETMHAISQLIADHRRVVFLLGMDREKVAAGLAHHQSGILRFLEPGRKEEEVGMEYGHQYVEKFVQIPFRVPQPSVREVERYFEKLANPPEPGMTRVGVKRSGGRSTGGEEAWPRIQVHVAPRDSEEVKHVFVALSPAMDANPRRLKQFLNLFRLRTYIAAETGLFDRTSVTLPQIGKFVALTIQWPVLVSRLDDDPDLLRRLEARVAGPGAVSPSQQDDVWLRDARLVTLLRIGVADATRRAGEDPAAWSLRDFPVRVMLATAPRVRELGKPATPRAAEKAPPPPEDETPSIEEPPLKGATPEPSKAPPPEEMLRFRPEFEAEPAESERDRPPA